MAWNRVSTNVVVLLGFVCAACVPEEVESTDDIGSTTDDGPNPFDPLCGDWSALKTRALGLDHVWTDGLDVIALGGGDIVARSDGSWLDSEAATSDRLLYRSDGVWGPAIDDHWVLGAISSAAPGVFHNDGTTLTQEVEFPAPYTVVGDLNPRDLTGSGPDDIWAIAVPSCQTFDCDWDIDCECSTLGAVALHFDGVAWSSVDIPIFAQQLWTDGATTWAVGGRDIAWLPPTGAQVARFDGVDWTMLAPDDAPPLHAVWATGADEVWVGGETGTLRHFDQGLWTDHDQPGVGRIIEIDGRSAVEVWALDEAGQLYAWDGTQWSAWLSIPQAHDFVVHDDGLIVVGEEAGHWVALVDVELETVTPLYTRDGTFWPGTMVVDDMSTAVASNLGGVAPSRRWDGQSWTPTYPDFPLGVSALRGATDQGWASRYANPDWNPDPDPDGAHLHQIIDGQPIAVDLPAPNLAVSVIEVLTLGGQEQLWIGGRTHSGTVDAFLYAREGDVWVERTPPMLPDSSHGVNDITAAEDRVFVDFASDELWMFEDGQWTAIASPPFGAGSLAATRKDELWTTSYVDQQTGFRLYRWNGQIWEAGADLFPAIADEGDWWHLKAHAPDDLWMLTDSFFEPERLAHFDGQSWTIVDTPALLHGWHERQGLLLAPADDGLFIHDGIRLWRYDFCPN